MRLYRNDDMIAEVQWFGDQVAARAYCGRGRFERVEVPTDKSGLLEFLNTGQAIAPTTVTPAPEPGSSCLSVDQVEAWLLDTATSADIERMFAAFGARFHEMRKAAGQ